MSHLKSSLVAPVALLVCLIAQDVRGQDIAVTLLGTGAGIPEIERFGPSILVQAGSQTLLFDVGRGAHQRLAQAGVAASQIDAVFLTHLHSDHIIGIPDLWLTGWLTARRNRPWEVFGPTGTLAMMNASKVAFTADNARIDETGGLVPPAAGAQLNAHEIQSASCMSAMGSASAPSEWSTGRSLLHTATGSTTRAGRSSCQETRWFRRISSKALLARSCLSTRSFKSVTSF
jgi:ribonuclease BN (tRNA processing enzyme)